ncbi:MAG: serine protease [Candidatus Obscuribacterales bacterium]|nr:serine protease [Candidatus Obscuribacterales bacterium]
MSENRIPALQIDIPFVKPEKQQPDLDEASRKLYAESFPNIVRIETSKTTGSGFAVQRPNLIVTDYHCIEGSNEVKVRTADGKLWKAIVKDIDDVNDLALLEIQGNPDIKPYTLGDEKALKADQKVVALGHPYGSKPVYISPGKLVEQLDNRTPHPVFLNQSVFKGRTGMTPEEALANPCLSAGQRKDLEAYINKQYLYTRLHVRPGNSGGPLMTEDGKVVGVTAMSTKKLNYSHSLFTPAADLKALLDRQTPLFHFQHQYKGAEWTRTYGNLLADRPLLTGAGTGVAGYLGYRGLVTRNKIFSGVLPGSLTAFGAYDLLGDARDTLSATTNLDRFRYGAATLGDAAMVGGGVLHMTSPWIGRGITNPPGTKAAQEFFGKAGAEAAKSLNRAGKVGLGILAAGAAVKYGSDFIPNRLVLTEQSRSDGDSRPPFRPPTR